jgi:cell division protein FtsB
MSQRARPAGGRGGPSRTNRADGGRDRGRTGAGSRARPTAPRRTAVQTGSAMRTRAPEPRRLTGRAMILGFVLLVLLLAYAYPVRVYLAQQAEIAALEGSQAGQREKIEQLNQQVAKWNDDEYVKSQARMRLNMVLPGEKPLVVIDPKKAQSASGAGGQTPGGTGPKPWYGKLWSSVEAAGQK